MQQKHHTIYQTTNLINGNIYIGMHVTSNLGDEYLGSGKRLKNAIKKYGRESFCKTYLHVFDNEQEMKAKEAELVTEEFCLREDTYNLCTGGKGGWSYVNRTGKNLSGVSKRNYSDIARKVQETKSSRVYVVSEHTRNKISQNNKTNVERKRKLSEALTGKLKTDTHKHRISEKLKTLGPKVKVTCPHCQKVGGRPIMLRHHFDNCKTQV